jgi:hypothetical protein
MPSTRPSAKLMAPTGWVHPCWSTYQLSHQHSGKSLRALGMSVEHDANVLHIISWSPTLVRLSAGLRSAIKRAWELSRPPLVSPLESRRDGSSVVTTTTSLSTARAQLRRGVAARGRAVQARLVGDNNISPVTTTTSPHPKRIERRQTRASRGPCFEDDRCASEKADAGNAKTRCGRPGGGPQRYGSEDSEEVLP